MSFVRVVILKTIASLPPFMMPSTKEIIPKVRIYIFGDIGGFVSPVGA